MTAANLLVYGEVCGCIVTCQGREAVSNEEWNQWVEAVARYVKTTTTPRLLVFTLGGAPSPEQRKRFDQTIDPYVARIKVAIVTDSTFARGVVKAIRIFSPFFQAFAPKELDDALRFLDLRTTDFIEIARHLEALRARLPG